MKTTVVCAAMLCGVAATSSAVLGQQYAPPAARPTARYAQPAARMAQRTPTTYAGARIQQPVSSSMAPAAMPSFRPINPPSQSMQRTLVASRTPTPAPTQARTASNGGASAQPLPAYQPTQGWVAPGGSMSYEGGGAMESSGYEPSADYSSGGGCGGDCCGGGHGCGGHGGHCCCQILRNGILIPHCSTGDMVQHTPFFGTTHGYYYFRPYHVMHVYSQQELATRWGEDPRNPYDNTMFQRIYEQMGIAAQPITNSTSVIPSAPQEYMVPGPTYTPTPVPYGAMPSIPMSPGARPSNSLPLPGIEPIPSPGR